MKVVNPDGVSAFTCTIVNTITNATRTYRLFDATGIVSSVTGTGHQSGVTYTVGQTALEQSTFGNPIVLSGFNYQVESSNAQFANNFEIIRASIDGRLVQHPNIIQKARYMAA